MARERVRVCCANREGTTMVVIYSASILISWCEWPRRSYKSYSVVADERTADERMDSLKWNDGRLVGTWR